MLKRKRMITTCSLSSCRIKAEALARVFNSRIWPCTWADRRRAEDSAEEDEEYFEASPIEDEDEDRGRDSSAATVEGRAKLFELLQQHANDDATEVFYDVSEHVENDGGNVSQSVVEDDGFEEIQLKDSRGGISEENSATGDVISSGKDLRNGECETMLIDSVTENSSAAVMKRSYFDDGTTTGVVIREEPKTSSFEKEILAFTWDSDSIETNQNEIYPKYSSGFLNEDNVNKEPGALQDTAGMLNKSYKQETDISLNNSEQRNLISETEQEQNAFELEKDELLTVSIDSESCIINQAKIHEDKDVIILNETGIINGQNDSRNSDTIVNQETESFPKDTEKEEILTVSIDSEICTISQCEVSDDKDIKTLNKTDINSVQNDSPNEHETESDSKDIESLVCIEIIKSSPPEKDGKLISNEHVSKVDGDVKENCRLNVFTGVRPTISRSTSLKTGKTPPGTPSRKKIVRFADVLGLDLEDVRHIISGDLPNIPSSAFSDLVLPDEDLPPKCTSSTTLELKGIQQGSWENIQQGAVGLNTIYPLFDIPGQQHDFIHRVRNNGICLENIIISDFNVQCTCRVMNWGFTKKVVARYSLDNWKSSQDINASYISDSSRDGMDSFAFNIFLSQQRCNVEFALCYTVNNREYWDNNSGKNYCLGYHSNDSIGHSTVPTSPTWIHQF